ncbi:MAG TPA: hypothetical protein VN622_11395 [Clostridia bacterium]|nr:hypothetical protein [Clostridia bacterium]
MKIIRRVTEPEVISEFLRNEFYQGEFHNDREKYEHLVLDADITNAAENALRRALLFRRRGHMWRELPADTQWWHVEIEPEDLSKIRVFPRAQWRKVADGSFLLPDVVQRIRSQRFSGKTREFISKVQALSYQLRVDSDNSCILLIGIDEIRPMTILEGNHRMAAALLASHNLLQNRFRIMCGLSPHMRESCWYETNFTTLLRYARNRIRNFWYDREADVRLISMPDAKTIAAQSSSYDGVSAQKIARGSK